MYYWHLWRKGSDIIFSFLFQLQNKLNLKIWWSRCNQKSTLLFIFLGYLKTFLSLEFAIICGLEITCESYF